MKKNIIFISTILILGLGVIESGNNLVIAQQDPNTAGASTTEGIAAPIGTDQQSPPNQAPTEQPAQVPTNPAANSGFDSGFPDGRPDSSDEVAAQAAARAAARAAAQTPTPAAAETPPPPANPQPAATEQPAAVQAPPPAEQQQPAAQTPPPVTEQPVQQASPPAANHATDGQAAIDISKINIDEAQVVDINKPIEGVPEEPQQTKQQRTFHGLARERATAPAVTKQIEQRLPNIPVLPAVVPAQAPAQVILNAPAQASDPGDGRPAELMFKEQPSKDEQPTAEQPAAEQAPVAEQAPTDDQTVDSAEDLGDDDSPEPVVMEEPRSPKPSSSATITANNGSVQGLKICCETINDLTGDPELVALTEGECKNRPGNPVHNVNPPCKL